MNSIWVLLPGTESRDLHPAERVGLGLVPFCPHSGLETCGPGGSVSHFKSLPPPLAFEREISRAENSGQRRGLTLVKDPEAQKQADYTPGHKEVERSIGISAFEKLWQVDGWRI